MQMAENDISPKTTVVLAVGKGCRERLKEVFRELQYAIEEEENLLRARGDNITVTYYTTGKLLFQGLDAEREAEHIRRKCPECFEKQEALSGKAEKKERVGTDESGKGDLFGPLVVAGVFMDENEMIHFSRRGLRDSKQMTSDQVKKLAEAIRNRSPHAELVIEPPLYNRKYRRFGNLNLLLAWAHARVIGEVLDKRKSSLVITDQFGDPEYLESALDERTDQFELIQRPRAERDPAVAAGAVLARDRFLKSLDRLEREQDCRLPRGAGSPACEAALEMYRRGGRALLSRVAKMHFRTIQEICRDRNEPV